MASTLRPAPFVVRFDEGVAEDARFLDGQFPDDPIVPGAVLLGLAAEALADGGLAIAEIVRMKFLSPLRPGVPFSVRVEPAAPGPGRITWHAGETVLAEARVGLVCLDA